MRFLRPVYLTISQKDGSIREADVARILKGIKINSSQFTTERYKPGTSGESDLYKDLLAQANLQED